MTGAPLRVGDLVEYRGGETHQTHAMTAGICTIHSTDEYLMCGYVEVKDALGRIFPIDARVLSLVAPAPTDRPTDRPQESPMTTQSLPGTGSDHTGRVGSTDE